MIKMRVISGKYKGRNIEGFKLEGTRPTMDRVKESLFAIIQSKIPNSNILDLFAGSGNLGIEALSNGAKSATFVDLNKKCTQTINSNIKNLKIDEKVDIYNGDFRKILKTTNQKYDIIFLDPPYHINILNEAIKLIEEKEILNEQGLLICEYDKENPISSLELLTEKKYGDKYIKIYKK